MALERDARLDHVTDFTYKPLPDQVHIRLVDLHPTHEDGIIRCSMRAAELHNYYGPNFIALSYEWTDPFPADAGPPSSIEPHSKAATERRAILVDGCRFEISLNLWKFLSALNNSSLAKDGHLKSLWADALCINQTDISEKSHQVQFMKTIYSRAQRVVAWLGCPSYPLGDTEYGEVTTLCQQQTQIAELSEDMISAGYSDFSQGFSARPSEWEVIDSLDTSDWKRVKMYYSQRLNFGEHEDCYPALSWLEGRSYWSRLWVIQETVLASQLLLMVGSNIITWRLVDAYAHNGSFLAFPNGHLRAIYTWRKLGKQVPRYLLDLLDNFRSCKCENFRDRLFGLIGMTYAGGSFPIDYGDSARVLVLKILQHFAFSEVADSDLLSIILPALGLHDRSWFSWQEFPNVQKRDLVCEKPVSEYLQEPLFLDVLTTDLHATMGSIYYCRCAKCQEQSIGMDLLAAISTDHTLHIYLCTLLQGLSTLGFLFVEASGHRGTPQYLATAEVFNGMWEEPRCATLLIHSAHAPAKPYVGQRSLHKELAVPPAVLDAMIFRYPRWQQYAEQPRHKAALWTKVWPMSEDQIKLYTNQKNVGPETTRRPGDELSNTIRRYKQRM